MEIRELEVTLEAALAVTRPTPRDVRDALVDYYATVARPFVVRGLAHTHPNADAGLIRRLLMVRLGLLWGDLDSPWAKPSLEDLKSFRQRVDDYACVRDRQELSRVRQLLDELLIAASVGETLRRSRAGIAAKPRFELISGGGRLSPPRGRLRLVSGEVIPREQSTTAS